MSRELSFTLLAGWGIVLSIAYVGASFLLLRDIF
jgi:hypothetical protein